MLQLVKNNLKYLKFVEEGFLVLWIMFVLKFVEKFDQNIFNMVFMIVALLLAACYYFTIVVTKSKATIEESVNPIILIRSKLAALGLSVMVIGILFRVRAYPGASIMLLVGTLTSLILLPLYVVFKGDNVYQDSDDVESQEIDKVLGRQKMIIRLLIAVLVGVFMISQGGNIYPYSAKNYLVTSLTSNSISENDAKLVAAWYDISNGAEQEKVLEAYQISQADLANAEKIAFRGNVPKNKKVSVDESYKTLGSYLQEENVQSILSDEDFEYIKSLRSIVYDAIRDEYLKAIYDLNNIANHTDNQDFINFVYKYYSRELEALNSDYIW